MYKFLKIYLVLIVSLWLFACESDESYNNKNAVNAFTKNEKIKVDKSISMYGITLAPEKKNDDWISSASSKNTQNQNIKKKFSLNKKGKITLTKNTLYWHLYSGDRASRYFYKPLIIHNISYSLDSSGILRAISLETEKLLFKKRIFPKKFLKYYQTPKISYVDGYIFAISGSNAIVKVDAKNGDIIWKKNISSIPVTAPLIENDKLFVTTNDNKIYCLNSKTADLIWVQSAIYRPTAIFGAAELVTKDELLFASFSSGEIYAIKKQDGEIIWSNSLTSSKAINSDFYLNDIDATPIIDNDTIYVIGNAGLIMAINMADGEYKWKKKIAGLTNFWISKNYLFVINNDNKLIAIRKEEGRIKWISQLPNYKKKDKAVTKYLYSGVVMAGSKLLISRSDATLIIADPYTGKMLNTIKIAKKLYHSPIVVGDHIYFYVIDNYIAKLVKIK